MVSTIQSLFIVMVISLQSLTLGGRILRFPLRHGEGFTQDSVREPSDDEFVERQHQDLTGKPGQGYYMGMGIGTPPQHMNILVDTGSSNFAVAAAPDPLIDVYFNTSVSETFENIGTPVTVPYTQGNWAGHLGRDQVTMATLPNVTVEANLACIDSSENFFINDSHWQGILGLAYADVARPDSSVEPFFDSLTEQTDVDNIFSMQLCGTVDTSNLTDVSMGGTLIIGGVDKDLYTPPMLYALLHRPWYYEVIITRFKVNEEELNIDCKEFNFDKTIVDSGTTNLRLPDKVFKRVVEAVDRHTHLTNKSYAEGFFQGEELLCWPVGGTTWEAFPHLTITLAVSSNSTLDLVVSPQQYLRAVPQETGMEDCYKFAMATSQTGTVLGAVIMEGYYVVFDREKQRIGFAKSTCENRDSTSITSEVLGPFNVEYDTIDCGFVKHQQGDSSLVIAAYVMAAVCGLCLLPFIYLLLQWQYHRCLGQKRVPTDDSNLLEGEFEVETSVVPSD